MNKILKLKEMGCLVVFIELMWFFDSNLPLVRIKFKFKLQKPPQNNEHRIVRRKQPIIDYTYVLIFQIL